MRRFFGGKKEAPPPPPSLSEATDTVNKRVGVLDDKIKQLDKQLIDYKNQIKNARPGSARGGRVRWACARAFLCMPAGLHEVEC